MFGSIAERQKELQEAIAADELRRDIQQAVQLLSESSDKKSEEYKKAIALIKKYNNTIYAKLAFIPCVLSSDTVVIMYKNADAPSMAT